MNQQRTAPGQRAIVPVDRSEQELNPTTVLEQVLLAGDLAALTPAERLTYYHNLCKSLGLNPYTRPFEYLLLKGKLVLYAKKDATEQLRKIHGVSIEKVDLSYADGLVDAMATARDRTGRTDVDLGSVHIGTAKGEELANARLKAVTKAKRRVTLSICGLGLLDETEVASIPDARAVVVDEEGAIVDPPAPKALGDYERSHEQATAQAQQKPKRATEIVPASPEIKDMWVKITAALQGDHDRVDADAKLPKPIAQMTMDELEKTLSWLEKRARNYAQYQADQAQQVAIEGEVMAPEEPASDPAQDLQIVTEQSRATVTEIRKRAGGVNAGDYSRLRALLVEFQRCDPQPGEMPAKDVPPADLLDLVSARAAVVTEPQAAAEDEEGPVPF